MKSIFLTVPNQAPVKKNNRKEAYTRKDKKTGVYMPLRFPISYYTPSYNEWAWNAVQYMRSWKEKNPTMIQSEIVATMWFFRKTDLSQVIDLQNLYDSICDLLAGNSGINLPKSLHMEHSDYQILSDDSFQFLKSHGISHIFQDKLNPRTEVFISDFKLPMINEAFKIFHPDIDRNSIITELPSKQQTFNFNLEDL